MSLMSLPNTPQIALANRSSRRACGGVSGVRSSRLHGGLGMTPAATIARTRPSTLPPLRVYPGLDMSFERGRGSTAGAIGEADRSVPRRARVIVRAGLRYWGQPGLIESADLLVTELVTNAFEHGVGDVGLVCTSPICTS
jgi:hypothetical protein